MAGLSEPESLLPAPPRGLAEEHQTEAKLQRAAEANHQLARERGPPTPIGQMVGVVNARMTAEAQAAAANRTGAERIPVEEGDPMPRGPSMFDLLVPGRFVDVTFDSYVTHTYSQQVALAAVAGWTQRVAAGKGPMLALLGTTGAGKSHLLYAALRALLGKRVRCYARPWYLLADELRYGGPSVFAPQLHDEPYEVRTRLRRESIIFIDEVCPTAGTAFDDTELAKLACHCYDQRRALLITTNVSPLADVMGPAAASRFTQIVVEGPDHRQQ
jgi:chromosomal replication initiation ATPase DnaA